MSRPKQLSVIDKLYRPPAAPERQVIALSRATAEKLPFFDNVGLISITAPGRPIANVAAFPRLLRLSFSDVDFMNSERRVKKGEQLFSTQQALEIRNFVGELPEEIRTVLVHCEGGYARSCAVALWLHQCQGYQADVAQLAEANPSVWSVLSGKSRARFSTELLQSLNFQHASPFR